MSVALMTQVFRFSRATGHARLVLLAIADCANDEGEAWPSVPTIARKARVAERSVYRHERTLVGLCELSVSRGGGRGPNRYRVTVMEDRSDGAVRPTAESAEGCQSVTPDSLSPLTACQGTPDSRVRAPLTPVAGESSRNHQGTVSKKNAPVGFDEFWQPYPRKKKRPDAIKAWEQTKGRRPPLAVLVAAVAKQWAACTETKFFPYPATWLRNEMWADEDATSSGDAIPDTLWAEVLGKKKHA